MTTIKLEPLPPRETIAAFAAKGFELSPSFSWKDRFQEDHAVSLTVAKAMRADILQLFDDALGEAIREGKTFRQFAKEVMPELIKKGWWGRKAMTDPKTGETVDVQLGSPRRLKTIFDVNVRQAYAAGAWARIQRHKRARPYLMYWALLDGRTRPAHRRWHGVVLPVDDPFWETHTPMNGWGCRCILRQASARDLARRGLTVSERPKIVTRRWRNDRTGQEYDVPDGVDPGFAYNPGRASLDRNAARVFADKSAGWEPRIAAAATAASARVLIKAQGAEFRDWLDGLAQGGDGRTSGRTAASGRARVVGTLSRETLDALEARGIAPASGAIVIRDSIVLHMTRDAKRAPVSRDAVRRLPELLAAPRAILRDKRDGDLLYVLDTNNDRPDKIVIRLDFADKGQTDAGRRRFRSASIRTAGVVDDAMLRDTNAYEVVSGKL